MVSLAARPEDGDSLAHGGDSVLGWGEEILAARPEDGDSLAHGHTIATSG